MSTETPAARAFRESMTKLVSDDVNRSHELTRSSRESAEKAKAGIESTVATAKKMAERVRERAQRENAERNRVAEIDVGLPDDEEEYTDPPPRPVEQQDRKPRPEPMAPEPRGWQQPPPRPAPRPASRRRPVVQDDEDDDFSNRTWLR
ncbi:MULTISPECIES: hypothetical protein [unclassified Saccharopolyspora]|uniref:hypothetical protein n=1 Tax=unclassified Saccharopolyspora TaxID=2646250 RepID=UPI001CD64028|nr:MULTISPECIES: hypothetical protein [unclassified Saccharopolyspora]MCA1188552.1 hypothetical protein [Saccharopolyspora sp. 6T]MCA1193258.1 hypothetical protein [Saccharopolyspora sp. 6V]MCA1225913.1 hypothetical protein [Saccharopolyspora sp. 6M]MCA1279675.1 hypothetical protein [Saccharopolyspora sp. 7B]